MEDTLAARHIALAKALERLGNQKAMIDKLETAAEIEPNKETYTILMRSYRTLGMAEKADLIENKLSKLIIPAGKPKRLKRPKRVVV